jgi:hypothetical protein
MNMPTPTLTVVIAQSSNAVSSASWPDQTAPRRKLHQQQRPALDRRRLAPPAQPARALCAPRTAARVGAAPGSDAHVIYVDDEHVDDGSPLTAAHFAQFGRHCARRPRRRLPRHRPHCRVAQPAQPHARGQNPGLNDNMYGTGFIPL